MSTYARLLFDPNFTLTSWKSRDSFGSLGEDICHHMFCNEFLGMYGLHCSYYPAHKTSIENNLGSTPEICMFSIKYCTHSNSLDVLHSNMYHGCSELFSIPSSPSLLIATRYYL